MFCRKCGTQIPEGGEFCPNCGSPAKGSGVSFEGYDKQNFQSADTSQIAYGQGDTPDATQKKNGQSSGERTFNSMFQSKKKYILRAGVVIAAVVVLFAVREVQVSKNGYKRTLDRYTKAWNELNANEMLSCLPGVIVKDLANGYDSRSELERVFQNEMDEMKEIRDSNLAEGKWDIAVDIISTRDFSKSELRELEEDWQDEYGRVRIKAAKEIDADIFVKMGEYEDSNSMQLTMVRIGGRWYMGDDAFDLF